MQCFLEEKCQIKMARSEENAVLTIFSSFFFHGNCFEINKILLPRLQKKISALTLTTN